MKTLHLKKLQATYFYFYEPTHTCNLVKDLSKPYFVNPPQNIFDIEKIILHKNWQLWIPHVFGCCTRDSDAFVTLVPGYLGQMASMLKIEDRVQGQKTPFEVTSL